MTEVTIDTAPCPCGAGGAYAQCCGVLHAGQRQAASAEELMRARYSAYALRRPAYLYDSWHRSTRPAGDSLNPESFPCWLCLEVVRAFPGDRSDEAFVEFRATFRDGSELRHMRELSRFLFKEGQWYYVDGEQPVAQASSQAVSRNAPCPCGSGKKFKRCCGR